MKKDHLKTEFLWTLPFLTFLPVLRNFVSRFHAQFLLMSNLRVDIIRLIAPTRHESRLTSRRVSITMSHDKMRALNFLYFFPQY